MILRTRRALLMTSVILLTTGLLTGCKSQNHATQTKNPTRPAVDVSVTEATTSAPMRQVEVMGTVQATQSASIASRISGNITKLPVTPGSMVRQGDLLVAISAGEITAQLLQAQAQFEQADRNLKREENLLKKNAATPEKVKTLEESRRIAEAALREARAMLDYTTIEAPFAGIITRKSVSIGDLATPGKPLLQLEDESNLQVIADIPETLILGLSIDDTLPVYIPAAKLNTSGTVIEITPAADPRSRTAPVKLAIEPEKGLRSGQFARVSLPGSRGSAVMIPTAALHPFGQLERVFVADQDMARLRLVKTGLADNDQVEILSGINPGDRVIISASGQLTDSQPINVR